MIKQRVRAVYFLLLPPCMLILEEIIKYFCVRLEAGISDSNIRVLALSITKQILFHIRNVTEQPEQRKPQLSEAIILVNQLIIINGVFSMNHLLQKKSENDKRRFP